GVVALTVFVVLGARDDCARRS
ncbi:MAG: hypothetical protein RLZ44_630, partial [Pseudomonadota bacterium]